MVCCVMDKVGKTLVRSTVKIWYMYLISSGYPPSSYTPFQSNAKIPFLFCYISFIWRRKLYFKICKVLLFLNVIPDEVILMAKILKIRDSHV